MENGTQTDTPQRVRIKYKKRYRKQRVGGGPVHPYRARAKGQKFSAYKRRPHKLKTGLINIDNIDKRTKAVKAYYALVDGVTADLGGADRLSVVEKALVHAFASATVRMYDLSAKLLLGETFDLSEHTAAVSSMVRVASRLGVERRPRDVQALSSYLGSQRDVQDAEILEEEAQ